MHLLNFLRDHVANSSRCAMLLATALGIAAFLFLRGLFATVTWIARSHPASAGLRGSEFQRLLHHASGRGKSARPSSLWRATLCQRPRKNSGTMQERFVKPATPRPTRCQLFYALKMALAVLFFVGYEIGSHWMPRVSGSQQPAAPGRHHLYRADASQTSY